MRCDEVMKSSPECVAPGETCQGAARRMREANIGFLPVCDNDEVVGVVTDRDLAIRIMAEGFPPETNVREAMTRELVSCRPDDDISEAERLMAEHSLGRMLVTDDRDRLLGVISLSDIAQVGDEYEVAETLRQVTEREARPLGF